MTTFHDYLCDRLADKLAQARVVVWYDPRAEFAPFVATLPAVDEGADGLRRVMIGDALTQLAQFDGSFFGLRAVIEPVVAADHPQPLIIYLPGRDRDHQHSLLMEVEKAGTCYEPQLRHLARTVLSRHLTQADIDTMLAPEALTYADVVRLVDQSQVGETVSLVKVIIPERTDEAILALWLMDPAYDDAIREKSAEAEMAAIAARTIGLEPPPSGTSLADARARALRYVLVGEFRADLAGSPPAAVGRVPAPPSTAHSEHMLALAQRLRKDHADAYVSAADQVENEMALAAAGLDASTLGGIDTFRFEETLLLRHCGNLIADRQYDDALAIVAGRASSFWADRDVLRQSQWGACRLMAELGREAHRVRAELAQPGTDPASWVTAYTAPAGWHIVDRLQRNLEAWVARMDDEPEAEHGLAVVRRDHDDLLKDMADGFTKALRHAGWSVADVMHQTRVYPDVVRAQPGRVAWLVVDALRYEMATELAAQLPMADELSLRPAIAALPTITPVGMAALLPGAAGTFNVVEHKGKVCGQVEGAPLPGIAQRRSYLEAKVPGTVDLTLGAVLAAKSTRLAKDLADTQLVIVRSPDIDAAGEKDDDLLARQTMDAAIGNVARAVRKLAAAGIGSFVVTADHGHLFSLRREDDMRTDNPGGAMVEIHRRCWAGHGGTTPPGTVRVSGAELGYDTDLDFVFPTGLGVFRAGGGLTYHHGGFSLQELAIPVLSFRMPVRVAEMPAAGLSAVLSGVPERITNRTFGVKVYLEGGLLVTEPVPVRVVLDSNGDQVGEAGMAVGGELDLATRVVRVPRGAEVSVGLMLTRDDCQSARILVLDPATDAVLAQSDDIPVQLGI